MTKLNPEQINQLCTYLFQAGVDVDTMDDVFELLADDVEQYMWIGLPFESALDKVLLEANAESVYGLYTVYQRRLAKHGFSLQGASLDDIVFQNRNKSYGAYALRRAYPETLRHAFLLTMGIVMILISVMQMLIRGSFSYWSSSGAVWLAGLGIVTYLSVKLYLQHERQNGFLTR